MPSFLAKLRQLASPLTTPSEVWPEFEQSVGAVAAEMPKEAASMKDRKVRPLNKAERFLYGLMLGPGNISATTYPNGTIAYDKSVMQAAMQRPEDVMAHELTHIKQLNELGPWKTLVQSQRAAGQEYGKRTFEQEAFEREFSKLGMRKRTRDISLGDK